MNQNLSSILQAVMNKLITLLKVLLDIRVHRVEQVNLFVDKQVWEGRFHFVQHTEYMRYSQLFQYLLRKGSPD